MIQNSLNWGKWQRELTKISSQTLEWVVAENTGHWIWDSPKGRDQLQQVLLRLVSEKSNY
ncbi:CIC11C00000003858 [Sungouiella intermedia]|nr:CIC11C00000003858 [[Candida] intermedia]